MHRQRSQPLPHIRAPTCCVVHATSTNLGCYSTPPTVQLDPKRQSTNDRAARLKPADRETTCGQSDLAIDQNGKQRPQHVPQDPPPDRDAQPRLHRSLVRKDGSGSSPTTLPLFGQYAKQAQKPEVHRSHRAWAKKNLSMVLGCTMNG